MGARFQFAIAAALAVAACTDAGAPLTTGVRIESGRDLVDTFFWRPRSMAFTRLAASGQSGAQDLWVRELDEADPRLALRDLNWANPSYERVVRLGNLLTSTEGSLIVAYDVDSHANDWFNIERVVLLRPDGLALADWAAPYLVEEGIRVGPLAAEREFGGFLTRAAGFMGEDLVLMGHRPDDPPGEQVLARWSSADGSITKLTAGLPSWTPTNADALAFGCVADMPLPCRYFRVLGCSADTPACPDTGEIPCAVAFARDVAGTTLAQFAPAVYDVNRGELHTLDGTLPTDAFGLLPSPDGRRVAWGDGTMLRVWDACTRRSMGCHADATPVFLRPYPWRPDSGAVSAVAGGQALLAMSADDGTCVTAATVAPTYIFYSGDSARMGWVDERPGDSTLWIADGLGRGAVQMASDAVGFARFTDDGRFLLVPRFHDSAWSLGVIDLAAPNAAERPLITATSMQMAMGLRRLVALTHWNSQDQSGRVELFDLAGGTSTVLAEAAIALAAAGSVDDAVDIAYVVRARAPSATDGLWLATLAAATP
jgi:hypothetical protein